MKISELVARLEAIRAEHGDLTVEVHDPDEHGWGSLPIDDVWKVTATRTVPDTTIGLRQESEPCALIYW